MFLLPRFPLPSVRFHFGRALSLFAAGLIGLVGSMKAESAERTRYPLTIQNCGMTITFDKPPQRAVSIGQNSTEILLSLGLAGRIAGTAVWVGPVLEQYAAENARIARLADNSPSFEAVVARQPDLVAVQFESDVGENGRVATREQLSALGIPTYISPADCVHKDNSFGGDGVRRTPFSMDLVYREIHELAQIFDINGRGVALIEGLKAREAKAVASLAGIAARDVSVVFWFSSKELDGEAFVAGRNGAPAYIARTLGVRNVITTEEEWPLVSWEMIAAADPTVIVVGEMDRRRYAADDPAAKLGFLKSDPVTRQLDAVRNGRFVMMDAQAMNPTIRTIEGITVLAEGIASFGLVQ